MKTSIWATCPKCHTELKIETDETELVQIECPDCHKVFAAKVPPRTAAPVREVFSQMPVLPPFQPARVHYQSRRKSDDSMNPAVLTALIVVCASAILIPLGFGGYYVYGKLSEGQLGLNDSVKSTQAMNATTSSTESTHTVPSFQDFSSPAAAGRKVSPPSDSAGEPPMTTVQPQPNMPTFAVPELNPPQLIQPDSSIPQTSQTPNSSPMMSGPIPPSQMSTNQMTPNSMSPNSMSPGPMSPSPMSSSPGPMAPTPKTSNGSNPSQASGTAFGISKSGLALSMQRFAGPNGVFIFVLHSNGHSVSNSIQELSRNLSIPEMHAESGSDHTTIGMRYSGSVDSVVNGIRFGNVSYVDEESRSIHVRVN